MGGSVALTCCNVPLAGRPDGLLIRGSRVRSPPDPPLVSVISDSRKDRYGAYVVPRSTLLCIMRSGHVAAARARYLVPWRSRIRWRRAHSSSPVPFPPPLSLLVVAVPST